jgi:hypothetical protein
MLFNYSDLIKHLPVRSIGFTTKRSTWRGYEKLFPELKLINDRLFQSNEMISINRQDIFDAKSNIDDLIVLTVYWGYPQGMRGYNFSNIFKDFSRLKSFLLSFKTIRNPTIEDFRIFRSQLKTIQGLGLSTYSKLLYFMEMKINGFECLILDQRLIDTFNHNLFTQFGEFKMLKYGVKAERKYPLFLEKASDLSNQLGVKPENIELFLFMFGKTLKPIVPKPDVGRNLYSGFWHRLVGDILDLMSTYPNYSSIELSKFDFQTLGNRKDYSFNLEFKDGRVDNDISGSAVARDLANEILIHDAFKAYLKGKHVKINLNRSFQLNLRVL